MIILYNYARCPLNIIVGTRGLKGANLRTKSYIIYPTGLIFRAMSSFFQKTDSLQGCGTV
jgi:hypothetical protein